MLNEEIRKLVQKKDKKLKWETVFAMYDALSDVVENNGDAFSLDGANDAKLELEKEIEKELKDENS